MADVRPDPNPTAPLGDGHSGEAEQIGQYTLIREIGRGGMGIVYEARQRNPRRVVAIKVLSKDLDNPVAVERFRREANVLARLAHPNIAVVFEADVAPWQGRSVPFYAMEYISGGRTLGSYLREGGHSVRERLGLLIDLCSAVHHGHSRGVLHRDLKPANVLIDADGRLKLIDFGVARVLADVENPLRTSGDAVIGTIQYMSPEQISGDVHAIDSKSDLYSLGVIAWELLTGKPPYEIGNRTIVQAAHLISTQDPPPLKTDEPELDTDLDAVLRRAMAKRREDRYASVAELADDLRRVIAGEPTFTLAPIRRLGKHSHGRGAWLSNNVVRFCICMFVGTCAGLLAGTRNLLSLPPGRVAQRYMSQLAMLGRESSLATRVMVVGIENDPPILDVAQELKILAPDFKTGSGHKPMRAVYAAILDKLVECRASVIAMDVMFDGPAPEDEILVAALKAAKERDVPVIAGMHRWDPDPISPAVAANVFQLGGVTGNAVDHAGIWTHDLAVRHAARPLLPSLALIAAMAKLEHGTYQIDVAITSDRQALQVMLYEPDPALPGGKLWHERTWVFPVNEISILPAAETNLGLPQDSEVLVYPVDLPGEVERAQAFVSAADVLTMSPQALTKRILGKVIVVGNFREQSDGGEKRHITPDGRRLPDAYTQVMAIDGLLGMKPVNPGGVSWGIGGCLLASIAGARAAGGRTRRTAWRKTLLVIAGVAGCVLACALLLLMWRVQLNPIPFVAAMLVAAAVWVLLKQANQLAFPHSTTRV